MTGPDDDFADFVVARWPDVEAVALVATLDPAAARELAVDTFVALRADWRQVGESGAPTTELRRSLLERTSVLGERRRLGALRPSMGPAAPADDAPTTPDPAVREQVVDPTSSVPQVLLDALARETSAVRAAGAATVLWDLPAHGLGPLLGRAADTVLPEVAAGRERLLAAHREARAADGLAPDDGRFDDDLADLLERVAAVRTDAPDPATLVRTRTSRVRRRNLVLGGAAALVVGGAGVAVARDVGTGTTPAGTTPSVPPLPPVDDPSWTMRSSWAPRGGLRADPRIPALLTEPVAAGPRLVYADDLHGIRVVVAVLDGLGIEGEFSLWTGRAGAPPEQMTRVPLGFQGIYSQIALVALGVPHPQGAVVLVLSRPLVRSAELSVAIRPTEQGTIERDWSTIPLTDGVGSLLLDKPPSLAARLRCSGYDGPLPRPQAWEDAYLAGAGRGHDLVAEVSAATAWLPKELDERTAEYSVRGLSTLLGGEVTGEVVLRVSFVTTPDGAVVRASTFETRRSRATVKGIGEAPRVIPAADARAPFAVEADSSKDGSATFAVVAPGAHTVQCFEGESDRPLAPAARIRDGLAVVRIRTGVQPGRIVSRDAGGHVLHDVVTDRAPFLFDVFGPGS